MNRDSAQAGGHDAVIETPVGRLGLRMAGGELANIDFLTPRAPLHAPQGARTRAAVRAIEGYFSDPGRVAKVPLVPAATPFQARLRRALLAIPCGTVLTYGDLARRLRSSPRAVGAALRANPVPILVPCHRVVASAGIGGFSGATGGRLVDIKRRLLEWERRDF